MSFLNILFQNHRQKWASKPQNQKSNRFAVYQSLDVVCAIVLFLFHLVIMRITCFLYLHVYTFFSIKSMGATIVVIKPRLQTCLPLFFSITWKWGIGSLQKDNKIALCLQLIPQKLKGQHKSLQWLVTTSNPLTGLALYLWTG